MAAQGNQPIKRIIAPTGDWFQILEEYRHNQENRCIMLRVIAWAIVTGDDIVDHIEGVNAAGHSEIDGVDYWYVHGDDVATNGKTWREIWNSPPPNSGMKDIPESLYRLPEAEEQPKKVRRKARPRLRAVVEKKKAKL